MGYEGQLTLFTRATSGAKWSSVSQGARQGLQFLTTVILAHLLVPSDFGLMSMTLVVIGFVALFRDLGTSAAVIQREAPSAALLCTIHWVNVGFGVFMTAVVFLLAPVIARFYYEPAIVPLLYVLSLIFLISGFGILRQTLLERDLAFRVLAKVEILAVAFGSIVAVGAAMLGAGVWSLVYQSIVIATTTTILLWVYSVWRPRLIFSWTELKSVSVYSLNLTGFNFLNYFSRNADYLLIGRFLGAHDLGYYTLAYRIMLYPLQNIATVIGRVMFPVYSRLQEDDAVFRRAYLRVAGAIATITFPAMLGLMVVSKPFVLTVFGNEWLPIATLLVILAPVGLVQSIGTTVGAIYQAKGRTDWMLRWGGVSAILIILAFVIGLRWGIVGVASAYALITLILAYPSFSIPFRLINLRIRDLCGVLWRPFLSSVLMMMAIVGLRATLSSTTISNGTVIGILVLAGVVIYATASWFLNRDQIRQVMTAITNRP